jgi:hypothetical protein
MSDEIAVEKKFRILSEICRASHFAWREAVLRRCPDVDPADVVNEMWEITGVQTAEAYLKHIDSSGNLAKQVASSIVWSSVCMGEEARLEKGEREGEFVVRHDCCPWYRWHGDRGLLPEDRPGCDRWFEATIRTINERLGRNIRFETLSTLPEGDESCVRRIWEERD